jgi:hydrogenase maturation protease
MKPVTESTMLLIGYGNPLRQDDGAGIRVAERVEALGLPGVRVLACQELLPEMAEILADAPAVVFVDAEADGDGRVRIQPLAPAESPQLDAHAAGPAKLLALTRAVCGDAPPAWLLTVPARHFGIGAEMTETTRLGVRAAVREVERLAAEWYY